MKNYSFHLLLIFMLLGCNSTEGIGDGDNTITNDVTNEQIAEIKTQISNIQSSVINLLNTDNELRQYISSLQNQRESLIQKDKELSDAIDSLKLELTDSINTLKVHVLAELEGMRATVQSKIDYLEATVDSLQSEDINLKMRIDSLNLYVGTQLKDNKDWIDATFTTLDQYNATAAIVATIQGQIAGINERFDTIVVSGISSDELNAALLASELSIKSWINSQFSSYYTITQIDSKLYELKSDLSSQLDAQKTYLTGLINNLEIVLNNKIEENKRKIDTLKTRANVFDSDIADLISNITTNAGLIENNAKNINANSARINTCSDDIDSCNVYIAANKALIKANESIIEANTNAITALRTRMSSAETSINANINAINNNATDILNNASAIAVNAQDIAAHATLIASNATAISNNAQAISDNSAAISQLRSDLSTTRSEITAAYKKAISDAIIELDGKLSGRIATVVDSINTQVDKKVATINQTIAALTTRVEKCEQEIVTIKGNITRMQQAIDYLEEKVAAILSRIQSVTYVPEYSDGKATMTFTNNNGTITPGIATLSYRLLPTITATELAAVWENAISMEALYTLTRAGENIVPLQIVSVVASNGYLDVTVSGAKIDNTFFKGERKVSVTMVISDGNNQIATDYVELMPRMPETVYIPDEVFRNYLIGQFDTDDDGELSFAEVDAITDINIASKNIQNLSGIEWMHNLMTLNAAGNSIKSIDLHYCPKLTSLIINDNQLNSIDFTENTALTTLDVSGNNLQILDVSKAKNLSNLICSDNHIATLNISSNPALTVLQCGNNAIETLNLASNKQLATLDCNNNALTVLNLSYNTALQYLNCSANYLKELNTTGSTKLLSLDCSCNMITALNFKENVLLRTLDCRNNKLGKLDVSMCTSMILLRCSDNATLSSLLMEDEAQQTRIVLTKDNTTILRLYSQEVTFDDENLNAILLINYDFDGNGILSTDEADAIIEVNCKNKGITTLKGLERCQNMRVLDCSSNNIQEIILPNMENLNSIACYGNPLSLLDIHGSNITHLYLVAAGAECRNGKQLTISSYTASSALELNLKETGITKLDVTETNLTTLKIEKSTDIKYFTALNNSKLKFLELATSVTNVQVNGNSQLTALDVSELITLDTLDIYNNVISTLDVSSNTFLKKLNCGKNSLTTLNLNNNPNLKYLRLDDNNVKTIDLRSVKAIETLIINNNPQISILNLTENTSLTHLEACSLAVSSLDISANEALNYIELTNNNISVLKIKNRAFYESNNRTIYFHTGNDVCSIHDEDDNIIASFYSNSIPIFTENGVWSAKYINTSTYNIVKGSLNLLSLSQAKNIFTNSGSRLLRIMLNTNPNYTSDRLWLSGGKVYGSTALVNYFNGTSATSTETSGDKVVVAFLLTQVL